MPVRKAQEYFLSNEGYNCTQAIVKAFKDYYFEEYDINKYSLYDYGGSDNGKCGALAGAQIICGPKFLEEIEKRFIEKAGSSQCREIRKLRQLGCCLCVKEAAILVKECLQR